MRDNELTKTQIDETRARTIDAALQGGTFQSWVMTDQDEEVVFAVSDGRLKLTGAPYLSRKPLGIFVFALIAKASVITSKPVICDHFKTGQRSGAQDMKLFYRAGTSSGKFFSISL